MNLPNEDWRDRCRSIGLDPQEIRKVSERYDMYRTYTDEQGGNTLPLDRWYKWYRVEKLSEGHATLAPPATGCSIDSDAAGAPQPVIGEQDFLTLLQLYRQERPAP